MRHTVEKDGCEHSWCIDVDSEDELLCHECENNYYMAWDTTRCWKECPNDYVVYERDDFTDRMCGEICEND